MAGSAQEWHALRACWESPRRLSLEGLTHRGRLERVSCSGAEDVRGARGGRARDLHDASKSLRPAEIGGRERRCRGWLLPRSHGQVGAHARGVAASHRAVASGVVFVCRARNRIPHFYEHFLSVTGLGARQHHSIHTVADRYMAHCSLYLCAAAQRAPPPTHHPHTLYSLTRRHLTLLC